MSGERFDADLLASGAVLAAPALLGAVLTHTTQEGTVSVRLTEVEAYVGNGVDPGSHAYRGRTKRNAAMFGPPGHLYAYFTYGMHVCGNIVCSPDGEPSGVLMRAGEVIEGVELARTRRTTVKRDRDLARGPACLVRSLGISLDEIGKSLFDFPFALTQGSSGGVVRTGPRTGLSGPGGSDEYPWRFWIDGDPTVSAYKRHPKAG